MACAVNQNYKLECKDCLEFLKSLDNETIDLCLLDPPYSLGYDEWDKQWYNQEEKYLAWCQEWTRESVRVLKDGGMLCVFGSLRNIVNLEYKIQTLKLNPQLWNQNEIIWSYNWGGRSKKNFGYKHEVIWCFSKGEYFCFNADDVRVDRKTPTNPRNGELYEKGTVPTCVWEKNNHTTSKEFVKWHKTQKPLFILERIIKAYTNKNETVLDCFSGSGSTMIASLRNNRHFIGCDNNQEYCDKSIERMWVLL